MRHLFVISAILVLTLVASGQEPAKPTCPSFTVNGPAGIKSPGDSAYFQVAIADAEKYSFRWEVEGGTVVSGQGTTEINILVGPFSGNTIKIGATVIVSGLPAGCENTASAMSVSVACPLISVLVDELPLSHSRLDQIALGAFVEVLKANPNDQGFLWLYFKRTTPIRAVRAFEKKIATYLNDKLRPDTGRITTRVAESDRDIIVLYRVPPGAEDPSIEDRFTPFRHLQQSP